MIKIPGCHTLRITLELLKLIDSDCAKRYNDAEINDRVDSFDSVTGI
jgi:hypothetical protein